MSEKEQLFKEVNEFLKEIRQGDCYIGQYPFYLSVNPKKHIATNNILEEDDEIIEMNTDGFCILSQTCDIVRDSSKRHYLEICPLVRVDGVVIKEVKKAKRPNYVYIEGLESQSLVGDLDRIMTIEKSCIVGLSITTGITSDSGQYKFALAISRKRNRFAFPDEFNILINDFSKRVIKKHDRQSNEGDFLSGLSEIRVYADPGWEEESVGIHFHFIHSGGHCDHQNHIGNLLKLIPAHNKYYPVTGDLISLDEISASEYLGSHKLDLDNLSLSD